MCLIMKVVFILYIYQISDKTPINLLLITKIDDGKGLFSSHYCWIKDFNKVRDHLTGKFRGDANSNCNLRLHIKPYEQPVPVFFHNFTGYDAHLLMSALIKTKLKVIEYIDKNGREKTMIDGKFSVIANIMEKLISFSWGQFRFVVMHFRVQVQISLYRICPRKTF